MPRQEENKPIGPATSILDGIISGLFGHDTSLMTPEEQAKTDKARSQDQAEVHAMAQSAWKNPGAQFMNGPSMDGGPDLIKSIGSIMKVLGG